jgi:hypothetical protein
MVHATMLSGLPACVLGLRLAGQAEAPLACDHKAINDAQRPRYTDLVNRLRASFTRQTEIETGYTYELDVEVISLPEIAEWITIERLCCPFLTFQLDVKGEASPQLTLGGPSGVKSILRAEFSAS